ncbi:MAG: indoleacetamide hydrolase [Gammaproteobacteria bacterium]|nr:indoleacetamide hydrolase [Gammaproteobacteria bacterium]MCY4165818.1 indoleacetamide hydrolase [Gammaproteobacteria bacterium]
MEKQPIRRGALLGALLLAPAGAGMLAAMPATPPQASIAALRLMMANGELTSERLITQALNAAAQRQQLNAFIHLDRHGALKQAQEKDRRRLRGENGGPLQGIPIAVKDNIHVAGMPNTAGTPLLRSFVPRADAPVVMRLKAAGAVVLGKTNMHELAFGITSNNAAFGAVGNAWDPLYIAGGSSGGTAVAVAAGMAVVGLGTDTGGSSRIPAALNGIVGFRPTIGRYPSEGLTRISSTRDTVGPMGRSVADVALLDAVMADEDTSLPPVGLEGLRLGVPRPYFYDGLEPLAALRIEAMLAALRGAGAVLVEAGIDRVAELNQAVSFPVVLFEAGPLLREYMADNLPGRTLEALAESIASPDVKTIFADIINGDIPATAYRQAIDRDRPLLKAAYADYFAKHRVRAIIFPTTPLAARPMREVTETVELNGKQVPAFPIYIRNTDPGSNAGIPGLSIPLAAAPGEMPAGIEIDGPEGSDRELLAIGAAIETLIRKIGSDNPAEMPPRN